MHFQLGGVASPMVTMLHQHLAPAIEANAPSLPAAKGVSALSQQANLLNAQWCSYCYSSARWNTFGMQLPRTTREFHRAEKSHLIPAFVSPAPEASHFGKDPVFVGLTDFFA